MSWCQERRADWSGFYEVAKYIAKPGDGNVISHGRYRRKKGMCFIWLFLLRQYETCYFCPHSPGCFYGRHRCSGNKFQSQHLCAADPGLPWSILRSNGGLQISFQMTLIPLPLCLASPSQLLSIVLALPEFSRLKQKPTRSLVSQYSACF